MKLKRNNKNQNCHSGKIGAINFLSKTFDDLILKFLSKEVMLEEILIKIKFRQPRGPRSGNPRNSTFLMKFDFLVSKYDLKGCTRKNTIN